MNNKFVMIRKWILTLLLAMGIGSLLILMINENPIDAYLALIRGAFHGKLKFGTTLASFTPVLLTSTAFAVASKAGAFNVGVEGEVFLGAIAAAYIGINWTFLPAPVLLCACFIGAMAVGAAWAFIPGFLKVRFGVNEVCVTILMNSVAQYIASYLVSGPMSSGGANNQSLPVTVTLPKFMMPSNANAGLFVAVVTVILVWWMLNKTVFGYKIRATGTNFSHAEYTGINPGKVLIQTMMLSGALGGIAGCIEVLGVYGYYLDNFAVGLGSNGMLAALIARCNIAVGSVISFLLAVLKTGALGMQQSIGVPKSIVDTITAIFICVATMELLFTFSGSKKKKKSGRVTEENKEA